MMNFARSLALPLGEPGRLPASAPQGITVKEMERICIDTLRKLFSSHPQKGRCVLRRPVWGIL